MYLSMKNITKLSMVALALFAAACAQVEEPMGSQNPSGENVVVFEANVPTKTAISDDDKTVTWVAGDEVKFVWAGGEAVSTASKDGASTSFSVQLADDAEEAYVVYPSAVCSGVENGKVILNFNNALEGGQFSKADICVAKAVKVDGKWVTTLNFKNAACLLKVGVTSEETCRIQIAAVGEEIIGGNLTVSLDGDNMSFEYPEEGNNVVTMPVSAPGNYYIPVFPGVELSEGFRVNSFVSGEEAEPTQVTPFYYNGKFTTERGKVIILSEIEARRGQYYVTPEGTGTMTGQSWNNAMDVEKFKAFVTNQDNHFLLKGSTFHFSADEFSFGDDYLILKYADHANVQFTLQGTATQTDTTVFLGRTNTTESNKAGVIWVQNNCLLTVKNVKFTGTHGKSNSAVFRVNSGARELNLINCQFRDNSTPGGNGPVVALFNGATVNIEGCSFSENEGCGFLARIDGDGSVVNVKDTEVKNCNGIGLYTGKVGSLTLERVRFLNNYAEDESGTAAFIEGSGEILFKDCDFVGNKADWRGGAICISGDNVTAKVAIEGGKFDGNSAHGVPSSTTASSSAGGAAIQIQAAATVDISDVQFLNNYTSVGNNERVAGVIYACTDGAVVRCNNCLFDANYSYRSNSVNPSCPAITTLNHQVKFFFNGCEFKRNSSGGYAGTGGKYGQLFCHRSSGVLAFNNCYMHDNYGGRNTDPLDWLYVDNGNAKLFLSNTTIIGDPTRYGQTSAKNTNGVIYMSKDAYTYFINNILCSPTVGGKCINASASYSAGVAMYNKTSPTNNYGWGDSDTGSGHDYYATADSFDGLNGYMWGGSLDGENCDVFAPTAEVNSAIQTNLPEFYTWLDEIGALGKDMLGNKRGSTSWPGCYQE